MFSPPSTLTLTSQWNRAGEMNYISGAFAGHAIQARTQGLRQMGGNWEGLDNDQMRNTRDQESRASVSVTQSWQGDRHGGQTDKLTHSQPLGSCILILDTSKGPGGGDQDAFR